MNKKRVIIGFALIGISILLAFPKQRFEFLNWGNSILTVLFAFIPIALIGYGFFISKRNKPSNIEGHEDEIEETDIEEDEFNSTERWEARGKWEEGGTDTWQGTIESNEFIIENGLNTSHFARKFKYTNVKSIEIDLKIPETEDVEVFFETGTSDDREELGKLNIEKLDETEKDELHDGKNKIKPKLDWKDFSFFKVVLHRENSSIESPKIKNIKFEGEKTKREFSENEHKEVEENKNNHEEIDEELPAFEDVEYKDLECPECGEDFKTDIGLKVHRKVNHPDEFEENPEPYGEE